MKGDKIKYRSGYKYQLADDYTIQTKIYPVADVKTEFIGLSAQGTLTLYKGYAWDGCSGPTWDDKNNMRGGLIHDSIYQMMRENLISRKWRDDADRLFRDILLEDGMLWIRAQYYYLAVRKFADFAANPKSNTPPKTAP